MYDSVPLPVALSRSVAGIGHVASSHAAVQDSLPSTTFPAVSMKRSCGHQPMDPAPAHGATSQVVTVRTNSDMSRPMCSD
jgi:hypothetical protein